MAGNSIGKFFKITTWGESHGNSIGVVIDGVPPGLEISEKDIQEELDRRRPGQGDLTTARREKDRVRIMSGVFERKTIGTPLAMMVENSDSRREDYEDLKDIYRPSHADFTYEKKYGCRNWMGGGRASARETLARVAAGAVARRWLAENFSVEIVAWVHSVHDIVAPEQDVAALTRSAVDTTPVRCPDKKTAKEMEKKIRQAKKEGNSLGGVIKLIARGCPAGWGEPVFDKLDAVLAHHLLSIPAAKGVGIGSGFSAARMKGDQHNDSFINRNGEIKTETNHSGGIQGGISNGMPILASVAFKPVPTINKQQKTINRAGEEVTLQATGRHDSCVLPRAVPIVEAAAALTLADAALCQNAITPR
ncbi:MAG: chorismate synthase [bacterium]